MLTWIASGYSLRDYCRTHDIAYGTVQARLTGDELRERYEAARITQAETCLDEISELESKVESGELDPKAGAVLIGSKQWRMERLNPRRYSPRSSQTVDVRQWDMTKMHEQALKQLARTQRRGVPATITVHPLPSVPAIAHNVEPASNALGAAETLSDDPIAKTGKPQ
jgi:hypothetical protein